MQLLFGFLVILGMGCNGKKNPTTLQNNPLSGNPIIDGITEKIRETPNDPALYIERANAYNDAEAFEQAIGDLQMALQIDSLNPTYYHLLADVYYDYYQSKQALETMQKAADLFPTRPQTLLKLSEYQMFLKQHGTAIQTAERVLELVPRHPDALYMIGTNYKHLGDTKQAIAFMKEAVQENPDLLDGYVHLGILMDDSNLAGQDKRALQYLDNALRIDSTAINALFAKAWFFHKRDNFDAAKNWYRKIIVQTVNKNDERYVDACFNVGTIYLGAKELKKAYEHFEMTIALEPTLPKGYYYRGLTAKALGNMAQAKNDFQQTLNLDGNHKRAKEALQGFEF